MAAKPKPKKIPVAAIRLSKQTAAQAGTSEDSSQPVCKKSRIIDRHDIDEIEKELQIDLHRPLKDTLTSIFKRDGNVVITFPKTPRIKVVKYAQYIRWKFRNVDCIAVGSSPEEKDCMAQPNGDNTSDIQVDVVEVLIATVPSYIRNIEDRLRNDLHIAHPQVHVVKLIAEEYGHILSVDEESLVVHFEHYYPSKLLDDTSLFLKVTFQSPVSQKLTTIWISLKTLLPIRYNADTKVLYTQLYPSTGSSAGYTGTNSGDDVPRTVAQPFHWISAVVNNALYEYHEQGSEDQMAVYLASATVEHRITRRASDNFAVIANSTQRFILEYYDFGGETAVPEFLNSN